MGDLGDNAVVSKILLVDSTNNFLRCFAVIPTLNNDGEPNGGTFGFLRSLAFFARMTDCDQIILVWDGPGGSKKRKDILSSYKEGRKPMRLNRNFDFELIDPEQNKIRQRLRLGEYLSDLPVTEITISDVEADDVIAYLAHYFSGDEKVIVSNDGDFYQLLDDTIKIYSPTAKEMRTKEWLYEKFNIHPYNFCLARAIAGDKSDKIAGVPGIGLKNKSTRLHKYFPFLSGEEKVTLDQLFAYCEEKGGKHKRFLDARQVIIDNYKIMQLQNSIISPSSTFKIRECLGKKQSFNATQIRIKMLQDDIHTLGSSFFQPFKYIDAKRKAK